MKDSMSRAGSSGTSSHSPRDAQVFSHSMEKKQCLVEKRAGCKFIFHAENIWERSRDYNSPLNWSHECFLQKSMWYWIILVMAGNLVIKPHFFHFIEKDVWESCSMLVEQERSLLSSLPTWPPRSKLSWNIPKVEDQSDGFLCLSLAFKNRAPPNTLWQKSQQHLS